MTPASPSLARRRILIGAAGIGASALLTQFAARGAWATPDAAKALLQTLAKGEPKEGAGHDPRAGDRRERQRHSRDPVGREPDDRQGLRQGDPRRRRRQSQSGVASFELTPLAGKAEVQIRVRMASTQKIVAVAQMSDGSLWTAAREIKVTIGGCGG